MNGYFTPDPGEVVRTHCDICETLMDVKRNVFGPTGWAEAMAKRGHLHDVYTCPRKEEKWHKHIEKLTEEMNKTVSVNIKALLTDEIEETLESNK